MGKPSDERLADESWLSEKYHDNRMSQEAIGDELGVCAETVRIWMSRHDIETARGKQVSEDELLDDMQRAARKCKGRLTSQKYRRIGEFGERIIQERFGSWKQAQREAGLETSNRGFRGDIDARLDDAGWMRLAYHGDLLAEGGASQSEIAAECGCSTTTVSKRMDEFGIDTNSAGPEKLPDEPDDGETTEPAVVAKVRLALDAEGVPTRTEVKSRRTGWRADIVADDVAFEAKGTGSERPDIRKGLGQALGYVSDSFEQAYVAAPAGSLAPRHKLLFDSVDVGLVAVSDGLSVVSPGGSRLDDLLEDAGHEVPEGGLDDEELLERVFR